MTNKPTYEALEKRVAELEQQIDHYKSARVKNPPELLSILMEAFRYIPLCKTFEDAAQEIFEQCKRITGARSGYVALLSENGEENEVLFLDAGGMPCDVDPNLPMPIRGLREIAYKTKDVAYENAFPESPWMEYMPEGHVRLENVLFAPLIIEEKTVGVIGIANKPGGFNEYDANISRILGDLAAVALSYAKAQEDLRDNEAKLRSILNASTMAIVLLNRSGCVLDTNEEHASRLKVSRDEILGRCLWEFLPKAVLAHRKRQVEAVFETGKPLSGEDKRGDVWNQYTIHPAIIDNFGKVQAVIVEAIDITERKMVEEELSQIFTMSMDMLCIADIHTATFIKVNPAFTEILGFPEVELLGKPFIDFIHPEDIDATRSIIEKKLQMGEKVINFENRYQCKNGKYRWLSWASHPNIEEGVTFAVARDITEQKRQEEALKHSKAILDATGRMAKVGGWELNADTMEVVWTEETYRIHEVPFDQKPPLQEAIDFFHPEDRPKLELAVERALDLGEPYDMEIRFITAKGKHLWTRTICRPEIVNGKVIKLMGTFQDITEQKQVEEALEESKTFLDNMSDIAYIADDQGNLIWTNLAARRMTGFLPEELIGKPFLPLFIQEDHASLIDVYQRTLNGEILENTLTFNTGITCHFTSLPKRNKQGDIIGTFGVARDISERQAAEHALQTSEARLKRAQEMAKVGNWEYDLATGKVWGSEEAFRIYGIERTSEFLSIDVIESYIIDAQRVNQSLVDLVTRKKPYDIEFQINPKNRKELIHVHSVAELVYDGDGKPEKVVGVIQDITERKQIELALKESEERFKALHNASFGGIAIHDKGLILECNKGLTEITGYDYDELIGMDGLSLISDDTRDKVIQNIGAGYEKPYEATGVRKSGEVYPLRLEARNIPYKGENVRVVEFRDISENKRAEKEKEELEGRLRQAQKMEAVGRLAGGVAHDFNNMLSVIIGHAGLALEDVDPSQPIYERLEEIRKAGERSANLTRQLLAFARKQTVSPKVLDLNQTVGSMSNMLQRLIGEDIDLLWLPGDDVWPVKVDPSQIDQILANLCVNARDAIADVGKVTIETGNVAFDEAYCSEHPGFIPGEYVLLAVSDDGCGMDAETLEKIFEPFFTTKGLGKGTGLGLAMVYGVVKQNDGFVNVYSEPDQGTTFKTYLPRYKAKADLRPEDVKSISIEPGYETILLVEDEMAILRLTTQMLERQGYVVVAARTPGEAIHLAKAHTGEIHLLVTDVVMPEMNGRDLAKNILSIYPNIKRLFMSGYTANVIAHHGVLDEGVNFIQKPFSRAQLGAKVREALGRGEA